LAYLNHFWIHSISADSQAFLSKQVGILK
jgi:hypothetical protein